MYYYDIMGYMGSFFISTNLIPQIYHIYKIKNADSISTYSIFLGILAGSLMGTYGILINKLPVVISNVSVCIFYSIIIVMKYMYSNRKIDSEIYV